MITAELSRAVRVDQVPNSGLDVDVVATPAECEALARRFGIVAVGALAAQVRLKPIRGGEVIRVNGRLTADVVQSCVVTLEPVPAHVDEEFDMTFSTAAEEEAEEDLSEIDLSLEDEDPPDPIVGGIIDVGEVVSEHLALALDPFPRKPGASIPAAREPAAEDDGRPNPFAVLAKLRQKKE